MKNYYEILEVNEKASPEIIDKVYKVLVKKYHPDLQPDEKKQKAEQNIKLINEAYDVLSDKNKRELYDKELQNKFIDINEYNLIINENIKLKNELNNIKSKINYYNNYNTYNNSANNNTYSNYNNYYYNTQTKNYYNGANNPNYNYTKNTSNQTNNANYTYRPNNNYNTSYYNKNSDFNILDKLKNLIKNIIAIFITFLIIFIIFQIPFFKNILFSLNFDNGIFLLPIIILFLYFINKK